MTGAARHSADVAFGYAFGVVMGFEGGASSDPNDRAASDVRPGEVHTWRGIRQSTWDAWNRERGRPLSPVTTATDDDVRSIYWSWYWRPAGCQEWPDPVALIVFDMAVNHGTGRAVRWLQASAGTAADGRIGPATRAAVHGRDPDHLGEHLLWVRARWFVQFAADPVQERNLRGWLRLRVLDLRFAHVWARRRRPDDRPHREEHAAWVLMREYVERAKDPRHRPSLRPGVAQAIADRYAAWQGYDDPIRRWARAVELPGMATGAPRRLVPVVAGHLDLERRRPTG